MQSDYKFFANNAQIDCVIGHSRKSSIADYDIVLPIQLIGTHSLTFSIPYEIECFLSPLHNATNTFAQINIPNKYNFLV